MFFVCKRRWDEMEVRRADETTESSSEGAMWCVPGARFFMPGGYAICLGVTRDSNLSISSATASRWLLWSFSTRPQPEQQQQQEQKQAQLWPFCICWLLQLPPWHGNHAKGQSPTPTSPARPQLQLMAGSRLQSVVHLNRGHQVQLMARPAGYLQTSFTFRLLPFQPLQTIQI